MLVYPPRSSVVTVTRIEAIPKSDTIMAKRFGVKLMRWKAFSSNLPSYVTQAEQILDGQDMDVQDHVGGGLHITMSNVYPFLQFRDFYVDDDNELKPGKRGIRLTFDEVQELTCHIAEFNSMIPALAELVCCKERDGHDKVKCRECTPRK